MSYTEDNLLLEVYFGKTESIKIIESKLDSFRKKYFYHDRKPPRHDVELYELNRLIEEQFGFGRFSLMIDFDPIPSAMSVPIDYSFNATTKRNNYTVDTTTYRFKKEYNYSVIVYMSTGLIFNHNFSTAEVMACLLYELGRNFYSAMSEDNAVLSSIYSAVMIANTIASTISTFQVWRKDTTYIVNKHDAPTKINWLKYFNAAIKDTPEAELFTDVISKWLKGDEMSLDEIRDLAFLVMGKEGYYNFDNNAAWKNKFINIMQNKNILPKIVAGGVSAIELIDSFDLYRRMVSGMRHKVKSHGPTRKVFYTFKNYLGMIAGKILSPAFSFIKNKMFSNTGWAKSGIDTLMGIFCPYKDFIAKATNPLTYITLPVEYRVERAAQNFPTMYGYGAELSTYLSKVKNIDYTKGMHTFINNNPGIGIFIDLLMAPSRVMNGVFDSGPNGVSSIKDQIALLKYELKKEDLDPLMYARIKDDITKLEIALQKLTDVSDGVSDPNICKKLYNKALNDIMGGNNLKQLLFDDKKKFKKYDDNYFNKVVS